MGGSVQYVYLDDPFGQFAITYFLLASDLLVLQAQLQLHLPLTLLTCSVPQGSPLGLIFLTIDRFYVKALVLITACICRLVFSAKVNFLLFSPKKKTYVDTEQNDLHCSLTGIITIIQPLLIFVSVAETKHR